MGVHLVKKGTAPYSYFVISIHRFIRIQRYSSAVNEDFSQPESEEDRFVNRGHQLLIQNGVSYNLNELTHVLNPALGSRILEKIQSNGRLCFDFFTWAEKLEGFHPSVQWRCVMLHILTKSKMYNQAQPIMNNLVMMEKDDEFTAFESLRNTYKSCNSVSGVFDMLIKSYSVLGKVLKGQRVLEMVTGCGISPSALAYNSLMDTMFRHQYADMAYGLYKDMERSLISPNVFTYNIVIRGLCMNGKLDEAVQLFGKMKEKGCFPNFITFNTLIDWHSKMGLHDRACKLMDAMQCQGMVPSTITYNAMINGLCKKGKVKEADDLLHNMVATGLAPDRITFNTLIDGHCRAGEIHEGLLLYDKMVENGLIPDVFTYNALINAMCKSSNLSKAEEFFMKMKERGLNPDCVTYSSLIDGYCKQGNMHLAINVQNEMIQKGFCPSVLTYNSIINGFCLAGEIRKAWKTFHIMREAGQSPDVVTYGTLIDGYCKEGNLREAFYLLDDMTRKGFHPDVMTYASIMQGFCYERKTRDACKLLVKMLVRGLVPDCFIFTILINGHCKEGHFKEAFKLYDKMIQKGLSPDVVTYSVLVSGLNKHARSKEANRLLFRMIYADLIPDEVTYDALIGQARDADIESNAAFIKGLCMQGRMIEAERVFENMPENKRQQSDVVYSFLIHGHCKNHNLKRAYHLYKEMLQLGLMPAMVTTIVLMKYLCKRGLVDHAWELLESILAKCPSDASTHIAAIELAREAGDIKEVMNILSNMVVDGVLPSMGMPQNSVGQTVSPMDETGAVKQASATLTSRIGHVTKNMGGWDSTIHSLEHFLTKALT